MNNEEDGQLTSRYSYQDFLELLSTYEGEVQARDVIIDCLLKKQQLTSTPNLPSNSTPNALESLVRDSTYIDSSSLQSVNRCCSSCSNNLLSTAKFLLSQREADIKIEKCLNLLTQRHSKYMEELAEKHKHILGIAKGEDGYIKELELERDQLFEQLKNRQDDFTELEEEKTKIEQKYLEEREREKLLVLFLLEERGKLLKEIGELKAVSKTSTVSAPSESSCTTSSNDSNLKLLYANLEEENKQLHKSLRHVHSEKSILQKRLDFLLRDLQQNEFQRQFHFLQPRTGSISEKEMIIIGTPTNNFNNNTMPPPFPTDKNSRIISNNKIKNSSSFPQTLDNLQQQLTNKKPPIERKLSTKTSHFDPQNKLSTNCHFSSSSSVVPQSVGNSTTTMLVNTRKTSQQQPKTNYNLNNNNFQQQQQQHYYRNINVGGGGGTFEQMKKYQQQPQTVICRRSTSLPRRIISAAQQNSPISTKHLLLPHNSVEHQQRNDFYQKPPLMGTTNYANNNKNM
uniref:Cortactin-binding protein-2 N-terminal domain-containing protein n=1 Tax=Meloidogyne enterolobii TaxID=390850 RepID=A0A6V7V166_MELEN|nr:unnamed protein product [Meloidogyne enterolobii]